MNTVNQELDPEFLRGQIIGADAPLATPFGERRMVYADYTASGRGLHFVEDYLKDLQRLYANSHTEDDTSGRVTTGLLHQAEEIIKRSVNAGPEGRIISCGYGATAAIDRMQQLLGVKAPAVTRELFGQLVQGFTGETPAAFEAYRRDHQPVVFIGPYEHHSNEISWRESLVTVVEVRLAPDGGVDLEHLADLLKDPAYENRLRIGSFSAASNVTGMRTPVHEIARLLHRHDAFALFDYAASAPYVAIDMNPAGDPEASLDAVFISPHKFLGGPGSSGVLVFNTRCYHPDLAPSVAGGGTVDYVGPQDHDFLSDIEARESAGTPGILQTIKAALAFEVKRAVGVELIEALELGMTREALERWGRHAGIELLGNPDPERRIGIVAFNLRGNGEGYLHPRFVTTLLNDLFGIQSRAGCSCAGPYGHQLLGIDDAKAREFRHAIAMGHCGIKPGWCRIGFHYTFDRTEFDYLLDAVEFVADHGYLFLPLYTFDHDSGAWCHKGWGGDVHGLSLRDALEARPSSPEALPAGERAAHYRYNLEEAGRIGERLSQGFDHDFARLAGEEGALQFFQLPKASIPEL